MSSFLRFLTIVSLVWCVLCESLPAQTVENIAANGSEVSTMSSANTVDQYLIGRGDVLEIRVYNRPQLSREKVRVDGQGMIRMPLIKERIRASCRTDSDLSEAISRLYSEYLKYPHVDVFITDFQSRPVTVFGAIREPGRFQMRRQIRLLELLSLAGGPTEQAGGRIQVRHSMSEEPCPARKAEILYTATKDSANNSQPDTEWFELKELLSSNRSDDVNNPVVRPGDIVNLIEADKIYVIGNVYKPTTISLKERVTLTQALAIAGGVMEDTNLDRISLSRRSADGESRVELLVDLKAINKMQATDIVLEPNDIVEVRTSRTKKFVRSLMESIAPGIFRLPVRIIP